MLLKKLLYKAFIGGEWMIGYRHKNDTPMHYQFAQNNLQKGQWVADPFLFEMDDKHYLFCEQYETKMNRAGIGYYVFEDGVPVNKGIVIRQPYHMSYPCVFTHGNEIYMIPETSANNTIELYRAVSFPEHWELDTVLLQDVQYVDSTVYEAEGELYLISYTKKNGGWAIVVFKLNMQSKELSLVSEKLYNTNIARPAGSLLRMGQRLYRPAQDCSQKYGEALLMYEVNKLDEDGFNEHCEEKRSVEQFVFPQKVHRIHTINQDSSYEVVDAFREQFDLLHAWKLFKRSVLKR